MSEKALNFSMMGFREGEHALVEEYGDNQLTQWIVQNQIFQKIVFVFNLIMMAVEIYVVFMKVLYICLVL